MCVNVAERMVSVCLPKISTWVSKWQALEEGKMHQTKIHHNTNEREKIVWWSGKNTSTAFQPEKRNNYNNNTARNSNNL